MKRICVILLLAFSVLQSTFKDLYSQYGWYIIPSGTSNTLKSISDVYDPMAVGTNGTILKSSNQGLNWFSIASNTNHDLNCINWVVDTVWVAGNSGILLKSINNGYNWQVIPTGVGNDLFDMSLFDPYSNRSWIVGSGGLILLSTNRGNSWQQQNSGTNLNLYSLILGQTYPEYDIWIVGDSGTILKSTNLGANWIPQQRSTFNNLRSIARGAIDTGSGMWIAGERGTILFSSNEGDSWVQQFTGTTKNLNCLSYTWQGGYGPPIIWAVGDSGTILITTNEGNNWVLQQSNTSRNLYSIVSDIFYYAFAVGSNGIIINSTLSNPLFSTLKIDPTQISTWLRNDGYVNSRTDTFTLGFEWPKGSGKGAIFASGLWLGAKVQNSTRVAVAFDCCPNEFYPGYIDYATQTPHGKNNPYFRIYKVSPMYPGGGNGFDSWNAWPVSQGAPWVDNDHNGKYNPPVDNPVMKGDQNLFCAYTDGYPESHINLAGSTLPLNADVYLYAYAVNNPLCADAMYMEFNIINKKNIQWDSLYIGLWSDPDLGDPENDKTGCDTVLNLGFNYNWSPDYIYGNLHPAFGYALYDVSRHTDRLLDVFNDPKKDLLEPMNYSETYNLLKGLKPNGTSWINPITNQPSKLLYSGDPETATGWLYGGQYGNDTRMMLGSYIGSVQPLDTIKFYVAAFIRSGLNDLNAVTQLKNCVHQGVIGIKNPMSFYPGYFKLYQNYPNPFNPITSIGYQIPRKSLVNIKIYDVLGRLVQVLLNEERQAGIYSIEWDGSNFASGVYFYKIEAGSYIETRKMVLIK